MNTDGIKMIWLNRDEPYVIHPSAVQAFELTNKISYQCNLMGLHSNSLEMPTYHIPWAIKTQENTIQIFSGWQLFNHQFADIPTNIPLILFSGRLRRSIETEAWAYALYCISTQQSDDSYLALAYELIRNYGHDSLHTLLSGKQAKTAVAVVYQRFNVDRKRVERQIYKYAQKRDMSLYISGDQDD